MNNDTAIHRKAEEILRKHEWSPLRQVEPKRDHSMGKNEVFEIWAKGNVTMVVHFYGNGNGVEFYMRQGGNDWASIEAILGEVRS